MTNCKKCAHAVMVYSIVNKHLGQYCAKCGAWQKWMPQNNPIDVMPFGKYKGQNINDIQDKSYLTWLKENLSSGQINMKNPGKLIEAIEKSLSLQ